MFGRAIAEFEFTLVMTDAPIDRFARGDRSAMTLPEKKGALLFFGSAGCVHCHAVAGRSNEMFSDFNMHVVGVPQIAPQFGVGTGNVIFDGPGADEDFGLEQITSNAADRYRFRTSPLRNVALQPAFFHNGAFTRLEDAIRHHLNVFESASTYDGAAAGVDRDLRTRLGPIAPVLDRIDPRLASPMFLRAEEFADLVAFVRTGLLDRRALPQNLCTLIPASLPSRMTPLRFEGCPQNEDDTSSSSNARTPVSISYRTHPNAQMSTRAAWWPLRERTPACRCPTRPPPASRLRPPARFRGRASANLSRSGVEDRMVPQATRHHGRK
jgi:cytochrome c peroxidase